MRVLRPPQSVIDKRGELPALGEARAKVDSYPDEVSPRARPTRSRKPPYSFVGGGIRSRRARPWWPEGKGAPAMCSFRWMTTAAAAVAAGGVALLSLVIQPAAAATAPTITVQPPAMLTGEIFDFVSVDVQASGTPPLTYQWQQQSVRGGPWASSELQTKSTLTVFVTCPELGGDGVERWRVIVSNAAGSVTSRTFELRPVLPRPTVSVRADATPFNVSTEALVRVWASTRTQLSPDIRLFQVAPGREVGADVLISWTRTRPGSRSSEYRWVASEDDDGTAYFAVATASCPDMATLEAVPTQSDRARVSVALHGLPSVLGPPPGCPRGSYALRGDLDGRPLNDGTRTRTPTCAACRARCRALPGCNTWVWGAGGGGRDRQCWLKAAADGSLRFQYARLKRPATAASPWVSGQLLFPTRCPGTYDVDYDGEVLNDGAAFQVDSCIDCQAACRARPGCNVWVYGVVGFPSTRHRQCWLKRTADPARPVAKPGPPLWLSGTLTDRA